MITLERVNKELLDEIVKRVNGYIRNIPKYPEKMLLPEDYFFGQCERLFHIKSKGYYCVYRLFDHGEVNVYFLGKKCSEHCCKHFRRKN